MTSANAGATAQAPRPSGPTTTTTTTNETQKLVQMALREAQAGNVRRAWTVRMRRFPPRIVIELKRMPPDLTLARVRDDAAQAAAREMLARRTMRYRDLERAGHGRKAIRDGITLLVEKGWAKRRGRGRGAVWVK